MTDQIASRRRFQPPLDTKRSQFAQKRKFLIAAANASTNAAAVTQSQNQSNLIGCCCSRRPHPNNNE
jgi:hypothetical protein